MAIDPVLFKLAQEKVAASLGEPGPFTADRIADVTADDALLASMARNRSERPGHYWLNPFVRGPLHELGTRLHRRWSAGQAGSWPNTITGQLGGASVFSPYTMPLSVLSAPSLISGGAKARHQARRDLYNSDIPDYHDYGPDLDEVISAEKREEERKAKKATKSGAAPPYVTTPLTPTLPGEGREPHIYQPPITATATEARGGQEQQEEDIGDYLNPAIPPHPPSVPTLSNPALGSSAPMSVYERLMSGGKLGGIGGLAAGLPLAALGHLTGQGAARYGGMGVGAGLGAGLGSALGSYGGDYGTLAGALAGGLGGGYLGNRLGGMVSGPTEKEKREKEAFVIPNIIKIALAKSSTYPGCGMSKKKKKIKKK